MVKVKALYHFFDKKACRNRLQGDVFEAPEEWVKEIEKADLVGRIDTEAKAETKKATKKAKREKE